MNTTQQRIDGRTPNGGVYSVAQWHDAEGAPCTKDKAVTVEIKEYDAQDCEVFRTYGTVGEQPT